MNVVPADGVMLQRILDATYPLWHEGLSRAAYNRFESAQVKTTWGRDHLRHLALVEGDELLACARCYDLPGILDQRPVRVCGIGELFTPPAHQSSEHARALLQQLVADAERDGAAMVVLFSSGELTGLTQDFVATPMREVQLRVTESLRYGAPMTLIRGGEERDLAAIVAMGRVRAGPFRFHLDRDVDFVQHAITKKRLLAGLGAANARQLQFFIAEEGITAAAYIVLSVVGSHWTIEECGDRDPSGARVGAMLQALLAREPVEGRPTIRGWLPAGFLPPQVTIVEEQPATQTMMVHLLDAAGRSDTLAGSDVLYWPGDVF